MKSKVTKKVLLGLLALAFSGTVATTDVSAQTMTNTGTKGVYHATCGAVLRMKAAGTAGTISGNNLGTATLPIPGIVDWATAAQTVPGYYYTRLYVSGTTATMASGIVVTGGACANATAVITDPNLTTYPYAAASTSTPTYATGDFTYAPSDNTSVNVWPAPTGNPYSNLIVNTGTGVIPSTKDIYADHVTTPAEGTVEVAGNLYTGAGTSKIEGPVNVDATGIFTSGDGAVNFNGTTTTTVADNGKINVPDGATGAVTFGTGTTLVLNGDLTVAPATSGTNGPVNLNGTTTIGASGNVNIGGNDNLNIGGTITNAGDGTNLVFDCTSVETYNGGVQTILPTIASNPYGSLILSGTGLKTGGEAGTGTLYYDVNVCNNFSLADGNLNMTSNNGALIMHNTGSTNTVTYAALEEVVGNMTQENGTGTNALAAKTYTYNNKSTQVTLADATSPHAMTLNVLPGTNPSNYNKEKDVNRKITITNDATADFNFALQVGYLNSEAVGRADWLATNTEDQMRFYEDNAAGVEKIGTGNAYGRSTAADFHTLSLAGIGRSTNTTLPNGVGLFASGNEVLLRAGATQFYSIRDGRWSNPGTWDEASIPGQNDDVFIRHTVYAGIDGPFLGTTGGADDTPASNTRAEQKDYGSNYAANNVTIINSDNSMFVTGAHPALVMGNEDNGANYLLTFKGNLHNDNQATGTHLWNAAGFDAAKTSLTTNSGQFEGIWLISGSTFSTANTNVPGLSAKDIQNAGSNNNEGLEEVRGE